MGVTLLTLELQRRLNEQSCAKLDVHKVEKTVVGLCFIMKYVKIDKIPNIVSYYLVIYHMENGFNIVLPTFYEKHNAQSYLFEIPLLLWHLPKTLLFLWAK